MRAQIISSGSDPEFYPWAPPPTDMVVGDNIAVPFKGDTVMTRDRYPVVAVGANACLDVMRNKFNQCLEGVNRPWLNIQGTIHNLAIGVTPFISPRGYLPATPFMDPAAVTNVWVAFLTQAHIAALDSTEPGYTRLELNSDNYLLTLDRNGQRIDKFFVYQADMGYMLNAALEPIRFPVTQREIFKHLQSIDNVKLLLPGKYDCKALARDHEVINQHLARDAQSCHKPDLNNKMPQRGT